MPTVYPAGVYGPEQIELRMIGRRWYLQHHDAEGSDPMRPADDYAPKPDDFPPYPGERNRSKVDYCDGAF